jgi:glycosyltransferase involved in cell wall biosynthesis
MKVALFVHCFFPDHFYGTETYTLQLAKNLQDLGHTVTVVTAIFPGEPARADLVSRYVFEGVPVVVVDKNRLPHRDVRETYWHDAMRAPLRAILRELACDVVHVTHLINHTGVLLEEAAALDIPVVATLTDFFGFCYTNKLEAADGALCAGPNALRTNCIACHLKAHAAAPHAGDAARRWTAPGRLPWTARALRLASALHLPWRPDLRQVADALVARPATLARAYAHYAAMIAPTTFLRDAYVRNGFPAAKLRLSRFGVDVARATKPPRADDAPLMVGYAGQIAPHKGVDLLVAALRALPTDRVRLKVYGPENQDAAYMVRLRALAGPNVAFLGTFAPERMAEVMRDVDLLAIPSTWYENSPLVLLNALATHTPVLVADVQGLTEFVEEGRNGWSFKRGDGADLARVLARLAAEPSAVRAASAATSYERTTAIMTADVAALYAQVIGG